MTILLERGEPYFFPRGQTGCLLVHGFTGSPWEMRWLAQNLAKAGYSTLGVRLFGHATRKEDLLRSCWQDWYLSALDGYHLLSQFCDRVFLIGQSLGGALCLVLGSQVHPAGIMTLSTPFFVPDPRIPRLLPFLPILSHFWRFSKKEPATDWVDAEARGLNVEYDSHPVRGGIEVHNLLTTMHKQLPTLQSPVLMLYSKGDATIDPRHAEEFQTAFTRQPHRISWLEGGGHNMASDAARGAVLSQAQDFLENPLGDPA